jgi:hypothetical protein
MRFLIISLDYPDFLAWIYSRYQGLERQPYDEQMRVRKESLFGISGFYVDNLRKLGHEASTVYPNNEAMQRAWAKEHGYRMDHAVRWYRIAKGFRVAAGKISSKIPIRHLKPAWRPALDAIDGLGQARARRAIYDVLAAQIREYRPDVLLNHDMVGIDNRFLKEMKPYVRLLAGQHAATSLAGDADYGCYDVVLSSFPPTVDFFRDKSISAELFRLGFEPAVIPFVESEKKRYDLTFIGSFFEVHSSRTALLEELCRRFPQMKIWGPGIERLPEDSPIWGCYEGMAYGKEMYRILRSSKITINHHGNVPPFANNLRLYEATGVGTLLITDWKKNLHEMFTPGMDVVTYCGYEECAERIKHLLGNEGEGQSIAESGQRRTLGEHTFYQRMHELVHALRKCF